MLESPEKGENWQKTDERYIVVHQQQYDVYSINQRSLKLIPKTLMNVSEYLSIKWFQQSKSA